MFLQLRCITTAAAAENLAYKRLFLLLRLLRWDLRSFLSNLKILLNLDRFRLFILFNEDIHIFACPIKIVDWEITFFTLILLEYFRSRWNQIFLFF